MHLLALTPSISLGLIPGLKGVRYPSSLFYRTCKSVRISCKYLTIWIVLGCKPACFCSQVLITAATPIAPGQGLRGGRTAGTGHARCITDFVRFKFFQVFPHRVYDSIKQHAKAMRLACKLQTASPSSLLRQVRFYRDLFTRLDRARRDNSRQRLEGRASSPTCPSGSPPSPALAPGQRQALLNRLLR